MAWIMHSSGPWKDHKYKERSGSPGNYTYKYGSDVDSSANKVTTYATGGHSANQKVVRGGKETELGSIEENKSELNNIWNKVPYVRKNTMKNIQNSYYADRTGYQRDNNARHDLVGDDNEAKKKHAQYSSKRKQFESQTLSTMRNIVNRAKANSRKTDGDMRDAAVARGREQYMSRRVANTVNNVPNALSQSKSNNKKSDADMRDAAVARGREQYMTNRAAKTVSNIQNAVNRKKEEEKRAAYQRELARRKAFGR
jgi:hypothetical protein